MVKSAPIDLAFSSFSCDDGLEAGSMGDLQSGNRNTTGTLQEDELVACAGGGLAHGLHPVDRHPRGNGGDGKACSLLVGHVLRHLDESIGVEVAVLCQNTG
jgi:hypothetical protein